MSITKRVIKTVRDDFQYGAMPALFGFFCGRATFFALAFSIVGIILAFKGKLDGNYALFVTAIQGLVFAHSVKEDWAENNQRQQQQQSTTVVNNIDVQK